MHRPWRRIAHVNKLPPTVTDDLDIHPSFVPLAAVQALSFLASAVASGQQAAVQQQPLAGLGLGQVGHPLGCGPCEQLAQPANDAGDGRLADPVEGAQQGLRQVVAQPHQGHRDRGGKVQRAVASAGWLPGADLLGDAVDEQIELFLREPGHRLGVQQSF